MSKAYLIIAVALALSGCESTVTDGDVGAGGSPSTCEDCQPAECPDQQPTAGALCGADIECEYTELHGEECDEYSVDVTFVCKGGTWVELSNYCSEYEPECPSELPLPGSYCDSYEAELGTCDYVVEGCEPSSLAEAKCDYQSASWQVTLPGGSCAECAYPTIAACAAADGCRWVEPSCDEPTPFESFCAPDVQCADNPCVGAELCVEYMVNDCWGASSEPYCCEGTAGVCEAPPPGED